MTRLEKIYYIFLVALTIFILGVQFGTYHGMKLAMKERCEYDFLLAN